MAQKPEYVLTRDYLDNNRLVNRSKLILTMPKLPTTNEIHAIIWQFRINLHHYLCVELFGYHIHPDIPTADPNLKVADVGTGTG